MKLVIDIPDSWCLDNSNIDMFMHYDHRITAVKAKYGFNNEYHNLDFQILPKGHGRLIDADNLKDELQAFHDFYTDVWSGFKNMPNNDKRVCDTILQCIAQIVNDPTVIEAEEEKCN